MVCDSLQMAGTCDMLVQNDDGEYFVADLKTSASVDYGGLGWAAQLAAYAHSDIYSPLLQCRLETPVINQQVGYIVHLPAGQGVCTIHQVDLVKGYEAAALANLIRDTRKASKKFITPVYTAEADTPATDTPEPPPEAPQGHTEALADRVRWLVGNGHGEKLQAMWPDGVPGLKTGGHTTAQIETITALVTRIENQVEAPFPSAPPTTSSRNVTTNAPLPEQIHEGEPISLTNCCSNSLTVTQICQKKTDKHCRGSPTKRTPQAAPSASPNDPPNAATPSPLHSATGATSAGTTRSSTLRSLRSHKKLAVSVTFCLRSPPTTPKPSANSQETSPKAGWNWQSSQTASHSHRRKNHDTGNRLAQPELIR
jgi:hypothetical protein